ncbi:hypothetical protein [Actinoplanes sp. DH11]|uniref:hypothetical protein n=1 Tax=Actinoplanes sp. DH11 TaxID=2857011 RepID=UPI001E4F7E2B|nr:hypothetical protein [Actinoplanes sp. DH11]
MASAAPGLPAPRPALACSLITDTDGIVMDELYLIDPSGHRRHLPHDAAFHILFRSFDLIKQRADILEISKGAPLSADVHIASSKDSDEYFLMTDDQKHPIMSSAVSRCGSTTTMSRRSTRFC